MHSRFLKDVILSSNVEAHVTAVSKSDALTTGGVSVGSSTCDGRCGRWHHGGTVG